jgi:CDP-diacylglycerol--glycerol-3-phosphate 3-phosphatidyltransferase
MILEAPRRAEFGPRAEFGLFSTVRPASAGLGLRMNLPNALTLARIFLVPLLVVVLLTKFEGRLVFGVRKELVGAAIFGIASLTDWLDGYLARRRQQVTILGQLMDPLADKLLITAALVSLVQMDVAPAWMVAVILGRELAVTVLRSIAYARGVVIAASPLGKVKMVSQVVAILLLILGRDHLQQFFVLGRIALWLAVITAVGSGVDYYRRFNHVLTGSRKAEGDAAARVGEPVEPMDVADLRNGDTRRAGSRRS